MTQSEAGNLSKMPKIGLVRPLDYAAYDRVYNKVLFPNSTEYRRADGSEGPMLYFVKEIIKESRPKTIVSIGAGTAEYDAELLRSADCSVENYLVIEPNPNHARLLYDNLSKASVGRVTVIEESFDPSFDLRKLDGLEADFIMFAHSLYFIHEPGKAVEHALKFLSKAGKLLVQHQANDTKVRQMYQEFNELLDLEWDPALARQDHLITTKTISDELAQLGISHKVNQEPASFFVDSFHNDDDDTATLWLCWMMNTDVTKFSAELRAALKQWVRKNSYYSEASCHFELSHPQGFILVEKT